MVAAPRIPKGNSFRPQDRDGVRLTGWEPEGSAPDRRVTRRKAAAHTLMQEPVGPFFTAREKIEGTPPRISPINSRLVCRG